MIYMITLSYEQIKCNVIVSFAVDTYAILQIHYVKNPLILKTHLNKTTKKCQQNS